MRTREKVYLGHPNLKRLLSSLPFKNFLHEKYGVNKGLDWASALAAGLQKYLRSDTTAEQIKGAFQQSKRCAVGVAKQVIALVELYKATPESKEVNWRNYNLIYTESGKTFKTYFRQYRLQAPEAPIDQSLLNGLWTVYSATDTCIFRSFMEVDFQKELHIYNMIGKKGRSVYCDIDSDANNGNVRITGDLEGTFWHYDLQGRFDQIKNGKISLIRGMVTIRNRDQLKMKPVLLWKLKGSDKSMMSIPSSGWGKVVDFDPESPDAPYEKSMLIYYQYLIENNTRVFDLTPTKNLRGWIKEHLKAKGRTRFDHYQKLLESREWISLSRQPEDLDDIKIYFWTFKFHPFKQAIIAQRIMREGEYTETVYTGEMKFHNQRFWVEFDAGEHQKKIMLLRSTEKTYPNSLYFLAMGSASFINFSNDPGDMLTEIVLPIDHLPAHYRRRYSLSYHEFKNLTKIPLELRLYLNHKDNAILSFDNPYSIKSNLQKQMAATAYSGTYHVYVYHRLLNEPYRLSRFTLTIDSLAVAVLLKADIDDPTVCHTYHGLSEESNKTFQIRLEHISASQPGHKKRFAQETRLIIDSSRGSKKRAMMTGIMSFADKESKPMGMPCLLVRLDNYKKDFANYEEHFEALIKTGGSSEFPPPKAHCLSDSQEYALLEELLWERKRTFLESRFAKYMAEITPNKAGFLKTYFEIIGGVFYSDYTQENLKIEKLLRVLSV